jgi:hypothetical protein
MYLRHVAILGKILKAASYWSEGGFTFLSASLSSKLQQYAYAELTQSAWFENFFRKVIFVKLL